MEDHDRFDDILQNNTGIFAADASALEPGLKNFDSAQTVPANDGVHITMYCRGCGGTRALTLGYHEMVAIKYRCPPQAAYPGTQAAVNTEYGWAAGQGAFYPKVPCPACQNPLAPLITPDEAERHLATARANGWIEPNIEARLSALAKKNSAAYQAQLTHTPRSMR